MTTGAKISQGNLIKAVASGGGLVTVAEILSITPPNMTRGVIDASTLDQAGTAMESIVEGLYDPGEVTVSYHHIDQNAPDALFFGAFIANPPTLLDIQLTFKKSSGTGLWTASAYVTSYTPQSQDPKQKQVCQVTLRPSAGWTKA